MLADIIIFRQKGVYFIGEDCDVLIIAGCGIHNSGCDVAQHDGVHTFHIGRNSKVKYVEKHYGEGEGTGERIMNPKTVVYLEEGASMEMDTTQIRGIDSTKRDTHVEAAAGAEIVILEKLLTHGKQEAYSDMDIQLNGEDSKARVISRSVAQEDSKQVFHPNVTGNARCFGHVQCDTIIMGNARVQSIPAITANHVDAQLIHEAAIGRIAGDQLMKLMTLGLTEEEAEPHFSCSAMLGAFSESMTPIRVWMPRARHSSSRRSRSAVPTPLRRASGFTYTECSPACR